MKNRPLWILLAVTTFVWASFWFLNFRVAASNTESEKNITTTSIGDGLPDTMQHREKINLALVGEGHLVAALQRALVLEMNNAGIGDLQLVQGIEPRYQTPVLVVKMGKPGLFWTPFFATSQFTIQIGYSSSGDTTLIDETPITISNQDGASLAVYGEYKVSDRSWGLISRPGYFQILADYLARQIVDALEELYEVSL